MMFFNRLGLSVLFLLTVFAVTLQSCKKKTDTPPVVILPDSTCIKSVTRFDTVVILALGQSNAANFGESRYTVSCPNVLNFFEGNYYPCADPLKGARGDKGNVWGILGDSLVQLGFAKKVIIAPCAIGGTSIQTWKPGGSNNYLIVETINYLKAKGLTITHVLWHQGESNNTSTLPLVQRQTLGNQYRSDFLSLVAQLRSLDVDAPVFPAIATRCAQEPDTVLQRVQRNLADEASGIFNGPDTDALGDEYRFDGCHFSTNGLKAHSALWNGILRAH
jgi:hypothetical protein